MRGGGAYREIASRCLVTHATDDQSGDVAEPLSPWSNGSGTGAAVSSMVRQFELDEERIVVGDVPGERVECLVAAEFGDEVEVGGGGAGEVQDRPLLRFRVEPGDLVVVVVCLGLVEDRSRQVGEAWRGLSPVEVKAL